MSSRAPQRRRLAARVYWFRRSMVLVTALALVFAIAHLLGGSGPAGPGVKASVTASSPSPSTLGTAGPLPVQAGTASASRTGRPTPPQPTGSPVILAEPTGPCAVDEITVTPTVPTAVAGGEVDLVLQLTGIRPACSFAISADTIVAKVTSGQDRIWSTQDCPHAIADSTIVVRSAAPTSVVVRWSGRRSDSTCSRSTSWALPGYYHVVAAAIGSEPGDAQFRLASPPRPVVTRTAHPKVKKKTG